MSLYADAEPQDAHERRTGAERRANPREAADRRQRDLLRRVREHPWTDGDERVYHQTMTDDPKDWTLKRPQGGIVAQVEQTAAGALTPEHRTIQEAWGLTDSEWDALCIPSDQNGA